MTTEPIKISRSGSAAVTWVDPSGPRSAALIEVDRSAAREAIEELEALLRDIRLRLETAAARLRAANDASAIDFRSISTPEREFLDALRTQATAEEQAVRLERAGLLAQIDRLRRRLSALEIEEHDRARATRAASLRTAELDVLVAEGPPRRGGYVNRIGRAMRGGGFRPPTTSTEPSPAELARREAEQRAKRARRVERAAAVEAAVDARLLALRGARR